VDEIVLIVTSSDTADCRDIVFSRPEMILDSNQANSMIERSAMSPPRSLLESLEFGSRNMYEASGQILRMERGLLNYK